MINIARPKRAQEVILVEGGINLAMIAVKVGVGLTTNSLAILSDAVHSLSDLANNVVAWFVVGKSLEPPDAKHPYGHRKFEVLAVFGLATLLSIVAFELALTSLRRLATDQVEVTSSLPAVGLMIFVLVVNLLTVWWQRAQARRLGSRILYADAQHTLSDALTTVAVIVGWQLAAWGYPLLDVVATLLVACLIFYMSFSLFRSTLPTLVDEAAVPADRVVSALGQIEEIKHVGRIRSRWLGDEPLIDLTIMVDPNLSTADAHRIADHVELLMKSTFNACGTTVHVEPWFGSPAREVV